MLRLINLSPLKDSLGSCVQGPSADRDLVTVMCDVPGAGGAGLGALSLPCAYFLFVL